MDYLIVDNKLGAIKTCAHNAGFNCIGYDVQQFRDGSSQIKLDSLTQVAKKDRAVLYYHFQKPFDLHVANVLRLLKLLEHRFEEVVLFAPFMPFLREHVASYEKLEEETSSYMLFSEYPIITIDAHINWPNVLSIMPVGFKDIISENDLLIFPDAGAARRCEGDCDNEFLEAEKKRGHGITFQNPDKIEGRDCIIIDDMVDTGYTLKNTILELKKHKAKSIKACITHLLIDIFDQGNDFMQEFANWGLDFLYIYDTISLEKMNEKACLEAKFSVKILDHTELFGQVKEKLCILMNLS